MNAEMAGLRYGKNAISRSERRQIGQQGGSMKSKQHSDWKGNQRKEAGSLLTQAFWMGLVSLHGRRKTGDVQVTPA